MNLLSSVSNPLKYNYSNPPPSLPTPDVWLRFENNMNNSGTNSANGATSSSSFISFNSSTKKEGSYSLALTTTGTNQTMYKYPSTGVYTLPNSGSFTGYTFSLWFNYSSFSNDATMVQWYAGDYTTTWLLINFQTGTNGLQFRFGNTGFNTSLSSLGISSNIWNHLAVTIQENGSWIVVINGARISSFDSLQTTQLSSMIATPSPLNDRGVICLGGYGLTAPIKFTGYFDSFKIFGTPLTLTQLQYLYSSGQ